MAALCDGGNSPPVHGEVPVEHPLAHLLPLDPAGELQVRELVPQQLRLHVALQDGRTTTLPVSQRNFQTAQVFSFELFPHFVDHKVLYVTD